nr:type VI secretion system-associated FHA domain protein TagH [Azospirillum sp. A1-3]
MLTLRITKGRLLGVSRTLYHTGLLVGRGNSCDWVLPDTECILSKQHFRIAWADSLYLLTDTSSNGVFHNHDSQPIGRDRSVVLADGDVIVLGDYEMSVELQQAARSPGVEPWDDGGFQDAGSSPFDANEAVFPALSGARAPSPAPATEPDHVPLETAYFRPPDPIDALPDDWFLRLNESTPEPTPAAVQGQAAQAAVRASDPPPPPDPRSAGPAAPGESGDAVLLAAFLAGAGLNPSMLSGEDPAAVLRATGATYRLMVEGLRNLLAVRASLKNEFRIDRTVIAATNNNPLKFSVDADQAMQQLLRAVRPGYLSAEAAVRQAFEDIQRHELAASIGMRAALGTLLRRFDPQMLKERLERQSLLATILPTARRSRYWELYEELYGQIAAEAEDDFQSLFGRGFSQAYEQQIHLLSDSPPAPAPGGAPSARPGDGNR